MKKKDLTNLKIDAKYLRRMSDSGLGLCTQLCISGQDKPVADPGFSRGGGVNPPGGA